ncbi:PH domain containing protein [Acanthamoeba castellanii str. Neff]|uniref:PH domain containing protein n=1 Tax=Acanthamoeba castellanii (strain ATCC 30010 / Neff) TaxID=1257118 RepID=L8GJM7_ACACF|nr:PH domain containing protein [Acanthamoeba castellanii str. Neff]ELR12396.1 PH domain containing protein [Acanthamoeba castellanii str. Neff]
MKKILSSFGRLDSTKTNLREIHERLSKRSQQTPSIVEGNRRLGRSFTAFGDFLTSVREDPELGECLAKVGLLEILLSDLLEKWNTASVDKLEDPINEFIKGEVAAAEQEKKHYDKAKAAFEAADTKLRQLKSKEDAKAFDIEKERNVLQERYLESRDQAQTALADAFEKNKFSTLEKMCDYIDAQHHYYKSALEAVELTKQKVDDYRRYITKKKKEYRSTRGAGGAGGQEEADSDGEEDEARTGGEVVRQGWLHRSVGKSSWKKSWVVVKYKYMYYYSNPDSSLGGVVRLTHCSVNVSTRKEFCFAINGRLSSQFFYSKSDADMQAWMEAVKTCIEEEEAHETRQLGKEEIKGNVYVEEEELQDEPEEEINNVEDPVQRVHLQLVRDEKKYLGCLTRLNKMYMLPLTADPKLKGKIQPDELAAMFGNIKPLTTFHTNLLKQLESVEAKEVSAVFLHNLQELESVYTSYLMKLSNGMHSLNACKQRVKVIKQFLTEREEILGEGNELATLLALPVQRVAQYTNVVQYLIVTGSPDSTLDAAHDALKALTGKLNQCSASSASLGKILDVRRRLHNYDGNLVDPHRRLLREGPVQVQLPAPPTGPGMAAASGEAGSRLTRKPTGMTAIYLFLFNDLMLLTKAPTISRTTYKVIGQLEMHKAHLVDEESATLFKLEEKQRGKHAKVKEYAIQCESPEEKAAWMTSLLNSLDEMKDKRKIYGIPLDQLMATREKGRDVPTIIEKATEWIIMNALSHEGIFRKAGRLDSIEDLKDLFNQGKAIEFSKDEDPYVVAGTMNHFLMELPDPILTNAMYDLFIDSVTDGQASVPRLRDLIGQLPPYNRYVLQHLMSFLQLVVDHEADNKMGPSNLAIVFGPTLLGSGSAESIFSDFTANQKVIEAMITNYAALFQDIEEERILVKKKMLEEEEAEKKKREMQQKRVTERLGAISLKGSPTQSPTNSGEIPVRPALSSRTVVRKSFLDRAGAPPSLPSLPPAPTGDVPQGTQISPDSGTKQLPPVPTVRKQLPRPPGSPADAPSQASSSPAATPGSPMPGASERATFSVPPRPVMRVGTTGSMRRPGGTPLPPPPGGAPPQQPLPLSPTSAAAVPPRPNSGGFGLSVSAGVGGGSDADLEPLVSNIRSLTPGSLVKQGWLTKKGGQRRNWKTRWCVLKTNEFSYYTNKKDAKPKGTIVLSGITVKPSSHKEFCFGISTTERTYLMAGKDATEQEEWVTAITACLKSLDP